ncbi:MAG: hypothetical protein JWQ19_142 [Subtercola sp.]|nr:hypothetical protein [Subtercola sp.]
MNVQRAITESYLHLAAQSAGEPELSVVLARAGVTRQQFSEHFGTLQDVSLGALEEMLWMLQGSNMPRRLDEGNFGPDAARSICDDIVARVADAWVPVSVGIANHRAAVQLAIGEAIHRRAAAYFAAYPGFRQIDSSFLAGAAHYVGHGLAAMVAAWVLGELPAEGHVVAGHMSALLPAWLTDPKSIVADPST